MCKWYLLPKFSGSGLNSLCTQQKWVETLKVFKITLPEIIGFYFMPIRREQESFQESQILFQPTFFSFYISLTAYSPVTNFSACQGSKTSPIWNIVSDSRLWYN